MDYLALNQFAGLVEMIVHNHVGVNPHGVVYGGQEVLRVNRIIERRRRGAVRATMHVSAAYARAGDQRRVAIGPVVTAIVGVAVP